MKRLALFALLLAGTLGLGFGADSDDITIRAYPSIVRSDQRVVVSGVLTPARANELVTVQGKECGVPGGFFRGLWGASTNEEGGWQAEFYVRSKTIMRAVSGSQVSPELTVRARAGVALRPKPGRRGRFQVLAYGVVTFVGKRVVIERFDPKTRTWSPVRTLVLRSGLWQGEVDGFRIPVPKGTIVRARLPLSQAKPCYLAGYSKLVRT